METTRQHPDLFTAEEAAAYLRLTSTESLRSLEQHYGLRPVPLRVKPQLYHRKELDRVIEEAVTGKLPLQKTGGGKGSKLKLGA